jgi:hypothetical protein
MLYLAGKWILSRTIEGWEPIHLHHGAALYYSLGLFIIGAQFLSIGLLGEMIAAFLVRDGDTYSIAEHTPPVQAGSGEQGAGSQTLRATPHFSSPSPKTSETQ